MKRIYTLLLSLACAVLPLAACVDGDGTRPLSKPDSSLPPDDGRMFRPEIPIPITSSPGNGSHPGASSVDPSSPAADTRPGGNEPNSPVPEPGTLFLVGCGLAGIAVLRRRRNPTGDPAEPGPR